MLRTRREESRRVARTWEQWQERAVAFAERSTVQQAALRIVGAVTLVDRRFAVLREVAFAGSTSRSKAFWTTLAFQPTSTLWEEARRALPLLVGGAQLRGDGGALQPKRWSTRAGWHACERRSVTKAFLTAHIKAHVTAMFIGKEDPPLPTTPGHHDATTSSTTHHQPTAAAPSRSRSRSRLAARHPNQRPSARHRRHRRHLCRCASRRIALHLHLSCLRIPARCASREQQPTRTHPCPYHPMRTHTPV